MIKISILVGRRPILWHIMMHYAFCGVKNLVIDIDKRGIYVNCGKRLLKKNIGVLN